MIKGIDPVDHIREKFKTANGFRRFVLRAGGNEAFSRDIAKRSGLVETDEACIGDVGLVATGDGATMAIKVDKKQWACKTLQGIAIGPFEQITAWRL